MSSVIKISLEHGVYQPHVEGTCAGWISSGALAAATESGLTDASLEFPTQVEFPWDLYVHSPMGSTIRSEMGGAASVAKQQSTAVGPQRLGRLLG